jgi:hypothetical protein
MTHANLLTHALSVLCASRAMTRTRKLESRRHGAQPSYVILRSPTLWDSEGSPQFPGSIHPSADGLAVQRNCRDSSSANKNGGFRMTPDAS